ncbi:MAG: polyprenyl synthetase family protein [Chloroflexota bacterium]
MHLSAIYKPVKKDLTLLEDWLKSTSQANYPGLAEPLSYSLQGGGKRIRPALTLLAGKLFNYNLDCLMPMAMAVELMHTATLVHDDAIDKSAVRWGRPTINSLWSEETAVLLGDYLFAKAGESVADTKNLRVIKLFSQTLQIISSGELNQAFSAYNIEQTREQYFQRIRCKTASLFSLATTSGAILGQAPEESVQALKEYGHNLGIAFQIVDDILDFVGTEEELGKPIGSDLVQGTITLPVMLLLEREADNKTVKALFNNGDKGENIKQVIQLIHNSSIVQECYEVVADYCSHARDNLKHLPDNPSRQALINLTTFIARRKR